ncbi:MAG: hypothetical protein OHK0038_00840 [Flammeovirgaceae bacterium]
MLQEKIAQYKRKYLMDVLLRGIILALSVVIGYFVFINLAEYFLSLPSILRGFLLFSFIASVIWAIYHWIVSPLIKFFIKKSLDDQKAALQIGNFFPEIRDKLLNTLQLQAVAANSDLAKASIEQNTNYFSRFDFKEAIDLKHNRQYAKYLAIPLLIFLFISLFQPKIFTTSTSRIINYSKVYAPEAPFRFEIQNKNLTTFKGDDFTVELLMKGDALPDKVYLQTSDGRNLKMQAKEAGLFSYTFNKIHKNISFNFQASGFLSESYIIEVLERPSLQNFSLMLFYPKYINKPNERIENTGNLIVPQGTEVKWIFKTEKADQLSVKFQLESKSYLFKNDGSDNFEFSKKLMQSDNYEINLQNQFSTNKDTIIYSAKVIPDKYPSVTIRHYYDTVSYNSLIISGNASDDYGISDINLMYRHAKDADSLSKVNFQKLDINFNSKLNNQSFFHALNLSELNLMKGSSLEFYVEVWDNDGVNGRKYSKSELFKFEIPSEKEIRKEAEKASQNTQDQLEKTLNKAKQLQQNLQDFQNRIKGKNKLEWQDKKQIENLLKEKQQLDEEIKKIQQFNEALQQKKNLLEQNEKVAEKAEQLQKLMNELLDEETKKLYEELNKLLEQNYLNNNIQDMLKNIDMKNQNLEKELNRAIELFKRLKFETKSQEIAKDLKELAEEQEKLSEQTKEAKKEEDFQKTLEKQKELNQKFDDLRKEMKELDELNKDADLNQEENLEQLEQDQQEINQEQEKASQSLENKKKKEASDAQKKSAQKMKEMGEKMSQMMQEMEMEQMQEDYDALRMILENLMRLSFSQEELMVSFRDVKRIDPNFVKLSQQQLKLKDDAKIIEDSLIALSQRLFMIQSFVTRELGEMNKYMDESIDAIKKRVPEIASSKQQFTMTSINNLALLLDDILQQMQDNMSMSGSSGSKTNKQKNKQKGSSKLSDLQKQLNQQIEQLKKSGKSGQTLSEELAKLAAEQEMIRQALKKMQEGKKEIGKDGTNGDLGKILEQMEKSEEDIVNKKLTDELIRRQKDIMTRLLESEKAQRERDEDEQRKAETAKKQLKDSINSQFAEYIKSKEAQIELLKTIPASLNQYYKRQVGEYFKRIK